MESYLLYGLLLIVCVVAVYYRLRQARFRKRDPNMARYLDAVESAEARRRVEAAAADQAIAAAEVQYMEQAAAEIADLQARAATDFTAATALRRRLRESQKGLEVVRRYWEKQRGKDEKADATLQALAAQEVQLTEELANLDNQIAQLQLKRP